MVWSAAVVQLDFQDRNTDDAEVGIAIIDIRERKRRIIRFLNCFSILQAIKFPPVVRLGANPLLLNGAPLSTSC